MADVLDTMSLRVSFALVSLTLLVLFYVVTYRTSRSAYAGWWSASLGLFLASSVTYLLDGTSHQVWGNPLGNALSVAGAGCVWASARSLRSLTMPWWWLAAAPILIWPLSALDDPAHTSWPAGGPLLAAMWIQLGLSTVELWRAGRATKAADSAYGRTYRGHVWALVGASGGVTVFYAGRWMAFLAVGEDSPPFTTVFGGQVTTLFLTALLTTVAFSMSTLSDEQQKQTLRDLAARDGLTGLLNRTGFLRLAEEELRRDGADPAGGQLILADLDHFKRINDEHGHPAGDRALIAFADACRASVRATDLVGRYGGEEFIVLLVGAEPDRAQEVTDTISAAMARRARVGDVVLPTVSFGITEVDLPLDSALERADKALYRAKETGRNRAVHHTPELT